MDCSNNAELDALAQSIAARLRWDVSVISVVNRDALIALGVSGDEIDVAGRTAPARDTICERTIQAGRPFRVADVQSNPDLRALPAVSHYNIGAYLGVPVAVEGRGVAGAVCAISASARLWQDAEVEYLIAVSDLVGSKIERHLLRYEQQALSAALAENDAILSMLSHIGGKALTVHNASGDLVFANSAMRTDLCLSTQEMLTLPEVARQLTPEFGTDGMVSVALPVPAQTALNVSVSATKNGLTLAEWSRTSLE